MAGSKKELYDEPVVLVAEASSEMKHAFQRYLHYKELLGKTPTHAKEYREVYQCFLVWLRQVEALLRCLPTHSTRIGNKILALDSVGDLWITDVKTATMSQRSARVSARTFNRRKDLVVGAGAKTGSGSGLVASGAADGDRSV